MDGTGSVRGAFLIVTAVSLYLLLPSLVSVFSSWRSLSHLNWYWAGLVLLAESASYVSLWQLDRVALRVESWFPVACAQLSGNALGRIVPGGGATATTFAVATCSAAPGSRCGAAPRPHLAASTALQLATTVSLPLLALPAIVGGAPVNKSLVTAAYLGIAVLGLLLTGGVIAFATDRPLVLVGRGLQSAVNRTFRRQHPAERIPQKLLAERDFIRATLGERWVAAVLSAAGNTGFDFIALLCALRAVGAQPRPSLRRSRLRDRGAARADPVDSGRARLRRGRPGRNAHPGGHQPGQRAGGDVGLPARGVLAADPGRRRRLPGLSPKIRIGGYPFPGIRLTRFAPMRHSCPGKQVEGSSGGSSSSSRWQS